MVIASFNDYYEVARETRLTRLTRVIKELILN